MKRPYNITDIANNEMREFAMYTIEARAIPSMIDGLKPVMRYYLYSSLISSRTHFEKVSAIGGVVTRYGYNHAEASAMDAGQAMAAEWRNNICLIESQGSFGTRFIQKASSPRYNKTRVHKNFNKYIKDLDLSPEHYDPQHAPPKYYLPIIPLVLVNGTQGIATGFATKILPRDPVQLIKACREYLKTGSISKKISIKYPFFKGKVEFDVDRDRFNIIGTIARPSKTKLHITEIPIKYDRVSYVEILDSLEESGEIIGYEDLCDKSGFQFMVRLKNETAQLSNDELMSLFKLVTTESENLTVIDQHGKLKEYTDERDLIKDFCDYRKLILAMRIAQRQKEISESIRWLTIKMTFIQYVIDDKIKFKNQKKDQVIAQIQKLILAATIEDADRLLRLNIMSLTSELIEELEKEIISETNNLQYWNLTNTDQQFIDDLDSI